MRQLTPRGAYSHLPLRPVARCWAMAGAALHSTLVSGQPEYAAKLLLGVRHEPTDR